MRYHWSAVLPVVVVDDNDDAHNVVDNDADSGLLVIDIAVGQPGNADKYSQLPLLAVVVG